MTNLITKKIEWTLKSGKKVVVEIKETEIHEIYRNYNFNLSVDGNNHSTSFETVDNKDCYKELRKINVVLLANKVMIFKPEADLILDAIKNIEAKHVSTPIFDKKENICPKCGTYCYGDCEAN